ncbi:MAG: hypothetical protein M1814_004166 [Vezdaea aestivalis]|nr:MAG: hypothetical protein M1814_004166 [Vezdaea aestivalis]
MVQLQLTASATSKIVPLNMDNRGSHKSAPWSQPFQSSGSQDTENNGQGSWTFAQVDLSSGNPLHDNENSGQQSRSDGRQNEPEPLTPQARETETTSHSHSSLKNRSVGRSATTSISHKNWYGRSNSQSSGASAGFGSPSRQRVVTDRARPPDIGTLHRQQSWNNPVPFGKSPKLNQSSPIGQESLGSPGPAFQGGKDNLNFLSSPFRQSFNAPALHQNLEHTDLNLQDWQAWNGPGPSVETGAYNTGPSSPHYQQTWNAPSSQRSPYGHHAQQSQESFQQQQNWNRPYLQSSPYNPISQNIGQNPYNQPSWNASYPQEQTYNSAPQQEYPGIQSRNNGFGPGPVIEKNTSVTSPTGLNHQQNWYSPAPLASPYDSSHRQRFPALQYQRSFSSITGQDGVQIGVSQYDGQSPYSTVPSDPFEGAAFSSPSPAFRNFNNPGRRHLYRPSSGASENLLVAGLTQGTPTFSPIAREPWYKRLRLGRRVPGSPRAYLQDDTELDRLPSTRYYSNLESTSSPLRYPPAAARGDSDREREADQPSSRQQSYGRIRRDNSYQTIDLNDSPAGNPFLGEVDTSGSPLRNLRRFASHQPFRRHNIGTVRGARYMNMDHIVNIPESDPNPAQNRQLIRGIDYKSHPVELHGWHARFPPRVMDFKCLGESKDVHGVQYSRDIGKTSSFGGQIFMSFGDTFTKVEGVPRSRICNHSVAVINNVNEPTRSQYQTTNEFGIPPSFIPLTEKEKAFDEDQWTNHSELEKRTTLWSFSGLVENSENSGSGSCFFEVGQEWHGGGEAFGSAVATVHRDKNTGVLKAMRLSAAIMFQRDEPRVGCFAAYRVEPYFYLWGSHHELVVLARVEIGKTHLKGKYEFWDGQKYGQAPANGAYHGVLRGHTQGQFFPTTMFSQGQTQWVYVGCTDRADGYVWMGLADRLEGPWNSLSPVAVVPNQSTKNGFPYCMYPHPWAEGTTGGNILMSWSWSWPATLEMGLLKLEKSVPFYRQRVEIEKTTANLWRHFSSGANQRFRQFDETYHTITRVLSPGSKDDIPRQWGFLATRQQEFRMVVEIIGRTPKQTEEGAERVIQELEAYRNGMPDGPRPDTGSSRSSASSIFQGNEPDQRAYQRNTAKQSQGQLSPGTQGAVDPGQG